MIRLEDILNDYLDRILERGNYRGERVLEHVLLALSGITEDNTCWIAVSEIVFEVVGAELFEGEELCAQGMSEALIAQWYGLAPEATDGDWDRWDDEGGFYHG